MGKHVQYLGFLTFFIFLVINACNSKKAPQPIRKIKAIELAKPEVFIDFDEHGMVQPESIQMLRGNEMAVLDSKLNKVFIFDKQGTWRRQFGGKGKGPGEFQQPIYIEKDAQYISVIDAGLYRINQYSYEGKFVQSYNFKQHAYDGTIMAMENKKYVAGSMGKNGSLIKIVDLKHDTTNYFGKAMGIEHPIPNLEAARQTLARGEIPGIYKNRVKLCFDGNYIYAFLDSYSRIQKYTPDGKLLWDTAVNLHLNKIIFQNAVDRAPKAPKATVPSYEYITNMKVVDGQVFLLWYPVKGHPRTMVSINRKGKVNHVYHIPEKSPIFYDFTFNAKLNKLYLSAPQLGRIYQTKFPD